MLAVGAARPIWNIVTPGLLLMKAEKGIRTRKVPMRLCTMTKEVFPQPVKKPVILKTKQTRIQSHE
jgi:hypothetical protein